jgi:hypothetical protein
MPLIKNENLGQKSRRIATIVVRNARFDLVEWEGHYEIWGGCSAIATNVKLPCSGCDHDAIRAAYDYLLDQFRKVTDQLYSELIEQYGPHELHLLPSAGVVDELITATPAPRGAPIVQVGDVFSVGGGS